MHDEKTLEQLLKVKDRISFFKDLNDEEIRFLIKDIVFKRFENNEIIFSQGENKDEYIYYIMKGFVNINLRDEFGIRKNVATVHHGSVIGEMKPILDEGRTAGCVAGTAGAVVIGFTIKHYASGIQSDAYAKFYRNMAYILAKKIKETNKRVR
ncbi:MAG: cyclic nucleotide-binding domain-containing protein [Campylobacterota bacterium]|nr:cyclic nucleotide-binding domain-containing protein [Campylobacterota bacterium]